MELLLPLVEMPEGDKEFLKVARSESSPYQMVTDGLPFADLKKRAHINPAAKAANDSPNFSRFIRTGRPGFGPLARVSPPFR